jgi:zinc/manganese transport system substrate-binding protein/manganese/iron transport system substrate-binding protein
MVLSMIAVVEAHLDTIDPSGAGDYAANAAAYATVIAQLDAELERDLATIPAERRMLIVFHDAFRYFAARYGFEVVGVVLPNPEGEPSARELVELIDVIEATGMRVIFAEPQFNTDVLSVLVEEADVVIGELLSDTFAGLVTSYVELMRFNRDRLVQYLGDA